MSIDNGKFETLKPWQYLTFTVSNKLRNPCHLQTPRIRVALLDSPVEVAAGVLPTGAMIVPEGRETDWEFCTKSGHLQRLFEWAPSISRLILISNNFPPNSQDSNYIRLPETDTGDADRKKLEEELQALLSFLNPKVCFQNGFPKIQFLPYKDSLLYRVILGRYEGPVVGQFIVEDVLMKDEDNDPDDKLTRNMRFKRMPKLIQSQVHLWPYKTDGKAVTESLNLENLKKMKKNVNFQLNTTILVHSHLITMVCSLMLYAPHLCEQNEQGVAPRALCLGVGGGALLSFLNTTFRFEVVGVEADKDVLTAAKQHFGFKESDSIRVIVGDAVKEIQNFQSQKTRFDVVMVDLDSSDSRNGICAPPKEFVKKSVFQAVKLLLDEHGVVIINVVYAVKGLVYKELVEELMDAFHKVYQIDGMEDNLVLMAFVSPPRSSDKLKNGMVEEWRSLIPEIEVYHRESYSEWSSITS